MYFFYEFFLYTFSYISLFYQNFFLFPDRHTAIPTKTKINTNKVNICRKESFEVGGCCNSEMESILPLVLFSILSTPA